MTNAQLKSQPWELTEAELKHNQYHIPLLTAALIAQDMEAIKFHNSQIFNDPDSLMASKINMGANWIRDNNYNTILADRKFGRDWLDK